MVRSRSGQHVPVYPRGRRRFCCRRGSSRRFRLMLGERREDVWRWAPWDPRHRIDRGY